MRNVNTPEYWNRVWLLMGEYYGTAAIYEFAASLTPLNGKVLDLGCGTGTGVRWLKKQGHEILGVDYASECAKHFEENDFMLADIQTFTPLKKFNTVLSVMSLYCLDAPERAVEVAYNALESGGKFIVAVPGKHRWKEEFYHTFTLQELQKLITQSFHQCLTFDYEVWRMGAATK